MDTQKVIDALTNGVGENPYYHRDNNGLMTVFVVDEQIFCTIPIDEHDTEIAQAICEAGMLLMKMQEEIAGLKECLDHQQEMKNLHG